MAVIARAALLVALCVLGATAAAAPATAGASGFRNPVVPQTAAGDDTPDPWIFRHAGRYWLTYTSTDHIEVRSARDLAGLADATPTRLWPPAGVAPETEPEERCCALWAPEIHRIGGRWYVYYAANGPTGDTHRMYVLQSTTDSPAGPYAFKAQLALPQPFAIDGTVATIRGRTYLIYSGGAAFTPTSLYIVALRNPWTVAGEALAISSPTLPWEQGIFAINEGPEVLRHGDRLHVIYSASWCGSKAYTLGRLSVAADADLLDAATWRAAKAPQPVFATSTAAGVFGPGHGSFFRSPDGRQSWMAYHATEEDKGCFTGGLRTTRVQQFGWSADGTPDFGTPVSLGRDIAPPSGDTTTAYQLEDVARGGAAVSDRRLVGYRGQTLPAGPVTLRLRVPRAGRYAIGLRLLGGPGGPTVTLGSAHASAARDAAAPIVAHLGTRRLARGTTTLVLRTSGPTTLDQLTITRRRGR
jgi:GH43 family beta-xylosidase